MIWALMYETEDGEITNEIVDASAKYFIRDVMRPLMGGRIRIFQGWRFASIEEAKPFTKNCKSKEEVLNTINPLPSMLKGVFI